MLHVIWSFIVRCVHIKHVLSSWCINSFSWLNLLFLILLVLMSALSNVNMKWSEVTQLCPTLCDSMDCSLPGSSVHGIFQARVLEWVAISFSIAWKWKVSLSHARLLATPWTVVYQAPPSMGFSRQEHWSGVPWPSSSSISTFI